MFIEVEKIESFDKGVGALKKIARLRRNRTKTKKIVINLNSIEWFEQKLKEPTHYITVHFIGGNTMDINIPINDFQFLLSDNQILI